jgi:hypothetical protein
MKRSEDFQQDRNSFYAFDARVAREKEREAARRKELRALRKICEEILGQIRNHGGAFQDKVSGSFIIEVREGLIVQGYFRPQKGSIVLGYYAPQNEGEKKSASDEKANRGSN